MVRVNRCTRRCRRHAVHGLEYQQMRHGERVIPGIDVAVRSSLEASDYVARCNRCASKTLASSKWLALLMWLDLAHACFSATAAGHPDIHLLRANRPHHLWGAVWTRLKPSHRPANQHKVIGQVRRPISPLAVLRAIPCSLAHAVPSANHPATAAAPLDQHYPKLRLVVAHIGERSLEGVCEACGLEPKWLRTIGR